MNWRPHTERPDRAPMSALLATFDATDCEGGYFLLPDLYNWDGTHFRKEATDGKPRPKVFWWIPESEVLQGLPE